MIHIKDYKELTGNLKIRQARLPKMVYLPLSQHTGKMCRAEVSINDYVKRGQRIATEDEGIFAPIHASISGKVTAIKEWPHPALGKCPAIVIESDGKDERLKKEDEREEVDIDKLSADEIRNKVFEAGIVGLGGAAFPTHIKLNPPRPVDTFILNAAECEPYLTSDFRLMLEKTEEILLGMKLVLRCLAPGEVYIAVEDNKPEAIEKFSYKLQATCLAGRPRPLFRSCRGRQASYKLKILKTRYPQGGEKQLIKNILKREVPKDKLPFDVGVVVHNVATVFAMYEAVYKDKPLYERVVTVSGDCLERPGNLSVRLGTKVSSLIEECGPLKSEPAKIIIGGPMMGMAQFSDEVPVIKGTTGVILFSRKKSILGFQKMCVRCAQCIKYCPVGLEPSLISLAVERERWEEAKELGILDCIECGVCSYLCPANRNLIQSIKLAKSKLLNKK